MGPRFDAHGHLPEAASPPSDCLRVVCGTCEADWDAVLAHAATDGRVLPMLGLHPWHTAGASPDWASRLEALLENHRAGLGECGLDFARQEADREHQEEVFRTQLLMAHRLRRPIAIHVVRAWGRVVDLLREAGVPVAGAMVHAFAGSPETARILQSMGVYLSFSGALLKPERPRLREAFVAVDASRLLLETDGAFDLERLVEGAASLRGMAVQELAAQTWENGRRCFRELLA